MRSKAAALVYQTFPYGKKYQGQLFKSRNTKNTCMFECPICYRKRRKIVTLSCDHCICHFCWKKWSKKKKYKCIANGGLRVLCVVRRKNHGTLKKQIKEKL